MHQIRIRINNRLSNSLLNVISFIKVIFDILTWVNPNNTSILRGIRRDVSAYL